MRTTHSPSDIACSPPAVQKPSALQLFQLVLQQGDIVRIFHQGALFGYVETIARNLAAGDGLPEQDLSIGFFAVKTALRTAKMYWGRVQELSDLEEWRGRPMWNAASETIDDLHDLYRWLGDIRACLRLGIFPKSYAERDLVFQREFDNIVDLGVSSDLPEFSDVDFDDIDAPDASENDASLDAEVRD